MREAPTFAVEVRSENDYEATAGAAKRADYFEAGTWVVWDLDPINMFVQKYRAASPDPPEVFTRGQTKDAEPAVVGWRLDVDKIFA